MAATGDDAAKLYELDEMKRRLKEMEEKVAALREMQDTVAKEMQGGDLSATTSEAKEEMDCRSAFDGNVGAPNATSPMFPLMYPRLLTGMYSQYGVDDQAQGPGIYAIQENQFVGAIGGYAPKTLIPLTYDIPTSESVSALAGEPDAGQQQGPQRQVVVRRFHFAFQLDLALIIKLAALVFLFSQEASKQRLFLLILFASMIYLYQTGAITPFLRWLQRAGGVAARPPHAPANHAPLAAQNDGNDQPPGGNLADPANLGQAVENQEPGAAAGNENQQGAEGDANRRSWLGGILKEVQLVVVGFIASLLPGFQHND